MYFLNPYGFSLSPWYLYYKYLKLIVNVFLIEEEEILGKLNQEEISIVFAMHS